VCRQCQDQPPSFDALRSWSAFEGPLRIILHKLKYRRDISLGDALAAPLANFVAGLGWKPDILIPIPLSRLRLAEHEVTTKRVSWRGRYRWLFTFHTHLRP
jgi:predicted amidophosphoribosyltransferase